ncbi:hypothetical protein GGX14DRAFT_388268 [Mycena pura]|uniref:Uncharacterized protein n=1 Tax=Mycena pura TaxID=153505 RepID=A0AAD6YKZ5_9AGAR|nr:hypothetical protein GGX14DRAFT_388268 [Mycena pura]
MAPKMAPEKPAERPLLLPGLAPHLFHPQKRKRTTSPASAHPRSTRPPSMGSATLEERARGNAKAALLRSKLDIARNEADARAAEMHVLEEHFAAQEADEHRTIADLKTRILSLEAELALARQQLLKQNDTMLKQNAQFIDMFFERERKRGGEATDYAGPYSIASSVAVYSRLAVPVGVDPRPQLQGGAVERHVTGEPYLTNSGACFNFQANRFSESTSYAMAPEKPAERPLLLPGLVPHLFHPQKRKRTTSTASTHPRSTRPPSMGSTTLEERANEKAARLREKLDNARNATDPKEAEIQVLEEHFAAAEAVEAIQLRKVAELKTKIMTLEAALALKNQQFNSLFALYVREHGGVGEAGVSGGIGEAGVAGGVPKRMDTTTNGNLRVPERRRPRRQSIATVVLDSHRLPRPVSKVNKRQEEARRSAPCRERWERLARGEKRGFFASSRRVGILTCRNDTQNDAPGRIQTRRASHNMSGPLSSSRTMYDAIRAAHFAYGTFAGAAHTAKLCQVPELRRAIHPRRGAAARNATSTFAFLESLFNLGESQTDAIPIRSFLNPSATSVSASTADDSALLRAIIDATGAFLTAKYNSVLEARLGRLPAQTKEAEEIIKFQEILAEIPFATSDSAYLVLAVNGEFHHGKRKVMVPPCVAPLWQGVLAHRPWIARYIACAGEVRNQCSRMPHGQWEETAVSFALAKSDFDPEVQAEAPGNSTKGWSEI